MLKKQNRLSSNFEFRVTKKYGEHFESFLFHIYVLKPNNYEGSTKVGFVISNKFDNRATKRNRVKRLFREAVQNNIDNLGKNLWITIYPKHACLDKSYEEISSEFNKILQKISIPN